MWELVFIWRKIIQIDWSGDIKPSIYLRGGNIDMYIGLISRMLGLKDV